MISRPLGGSLTQDGACTIGRTKLGIPTLEIQGASIIGMDISLEYHSVVTLTITQISTGRIRIQI